MKDVAAFPYFFSFSLAPPSPPLTKCCSEALDVPVPAADLLSEGSRRAVYHANRAASYLARASGGPLRAGEGNVEERGGKGGRGKGGEGEGRQREGWGKREVKGGGGGRGSGRGREEEGKGICALPPSSGFR